MYFFPAYICGIEKLEKVNDMTDELEQKKEKLLDGLIDTLFEVTEDNCDIRKMDKILNELEEIDPSLFEPFSVEESYQRFMEQFRELERSGALEEWLRTRGMEKFRA